MQLRWYKNVKPQDKDAVRRQILSASEVLQRLSNILQDDLNASIKQMAALENYDCPKWEYKMADALAHQRTLRQMLDLLKLEEK